MVTIIELCGVPGCGKSTALRTLKEKEPEVFDGLKGWSDLYPKNKAARFLIKLSFLIRLRLGLFKGKEQLLRDAMEAPQKGGARYIAKAVALYDRICRAGEGVYLLDEGLIQQASSAAYEHEMTLACGYGELFDGRDIRYIAVRFSCPIGESIRRNLARAKGDRYDIPDKERLLRLLEVKEKNIDALLNFVTKNSCTIDALSSPDECAKRLGEIIRMTNEQLLTAGVPAGLARISGRHLTGYKR